MTENIEQQFAALINNAHQEFKKRLEQQRWFETQYALLKILEEEVRKNDCYNNIKIKKFISTISNF